MLTLQNNGLRLRFDGPDQRLRLIEVLDFSKTRLSYKGHSIGMQGEHTSGAALHVPKTGPGFREVYKIFGPTTPGEYITPKRAEQEDGIYVLSYPGIAFSFPLQNGVWDPSARWGSTVSLLSSSASKASTSMSVFIGPSWEIARHSLFDTDMSGLLRSPVAAGIKKETVPKEIELVKIHDNSRIELVRNDRSSFWIIMGETTPQDLVAELGPPDSIHKKSTNNGKIRDRKNSSARASRRTSSNNGMSPQMRTVAFDSDVSSQVDESEESEPEDGIRCEPSNTDHSLDVFYNYYSHGLDILISNYPLPVLTISDTSSSVKEPTHAILSHSQLVVIKVLLHGNVPGSWPFNRHRRIRWTIVAMSDNDHPSMLTSEDSFRDISHSLQQRFHDNYANDEERSAAALPMVVNRSLGREEIANSDGNVFQDIWEDGGISSVRRLDQTTSEYEKIGGAEVYGFPGMVFEVLRSGAVSSLMVY